MGCKRFQDSLRNGQRRFVLRYIAAGTSDVLDVESGDDIEVRNDSQDVFLCEEASSDTEM